MVFLLLENSIAERSSAIAIFTATLLPQQYFLSNMRSSTRLTSIEKCAFSIVLFVSCLFAASANAQVQIGLGGEGNFSVPFVIKQTFQQTFSEASDRTNSTGLRSTATQRGKGGGATQSISMNQAMIGSITIGGMPFEVIFDSGSSQLWVFDKRVNKNYFTMRFHHQFYDDTKSEKFRYMLEEESHEISGGELTYADGTRVTFTCGFDSIKVGDSILMEDAAFGMTRILRGPRTMATNYDGIFGLGYAGTFHDGDDGYLNPFSKMVKDGLLQHNMYSVYMSKNGKRGEIMFGGIDPRYLNGGAPSIHAPLIDDCAACVGGHWVIRSRAIQFGEVTVRKSNSGPLFVEVDTGSSHMLLPPELFRKESQETDARIIGLIDEETNELLEEVLCAVRRFLPDLVFKVGDMKLTLTGYDYTEMNGQEDYNGNQLCNVLLLSNSMLQAEESEAAPIIFGAPLMRKYYTSFVYGGAGLEDGGKPFILFSEAVHPQQGWEKSQGEKKKAGSGETDKVQHKNIMARSRSKRKKHHGVSQQ